MRPPGIRSAPPLFPSATQVSRAISIPQVPPPQTPFSQVLPTPRLPPPQVPISQSLDYYIQRKPVTYQNPPSKPNIQSKNSTEEATNELDKILSKNQNQNFNKKGPQPKLAFNVKKIESPKQIQPIPVSRLVAANEKVSGKTDPPEKKQEKEKAKIPDNLFGKVIDPFNKLQKKEESNASKKIADKEMKKDLIKDAKLSREVQNRADKISAKIAASSKGQSRESHGKVVEKNLSLTDTKRRVFSEEPKDGKGDPKSRRRERKSRFDNSGENSKGNKKGVDKERKESPVELVTRGRRPPLTDKMPTGSRSPRRISPAARSKRSPGRKSPDRGRKEDTSRTRLSPEYYKDRGSSGRKSPSEIDLARDKKRSRHSPDRYRNQVSPGNSLDRSRMSSDRMLKSGKSPDHYRNKSPPSELRSADQYLSRSRHSPGHYGSSGRSTHSPDHHMRGSDKWSPERSMGSRYPSHPYDNPAFTKGIQLTASLWKSKVKISNKISQPEAFQINFTKVKEVTRPKIKVKVTRHKIEKIKVTRPKIEKIKVTRPKIEKIKVTRPKIKKIKVTRPKIKEIKVTRPKIQGQEGHFLLIQGTEDHQTIDLKDPGLREACTEVNSKDPTVPGGPDGQIGGTNLQVSNFGPNQYGNNLPPPNVGQFGNQFPPNIPPPNINQVGNQFGNTGNPYNNPPVLAANQYGNLGPSQFGNNMLPPNSMSSGNLPQNVGPYGNIPPISGPYGNQQPSSGPGQYGNQTLNMGPGPYGNQLPNSGPGQLGNQTSSGPGQFGNQISSGPGQIGNQINSGLGQIRNQTNSAMGQIGVQTSSGPSQFGNQTSSGPGQIGNQINSGLAQIRNQTSTAPDQTRNQTSSELGQPRCSGIQQSNLGSKQQGSEDKSLMPPPNTFSEPSPHRSTTSRSGSQGSSSNLPQSNTGQPGTNKPPVLKGILKKKPNNPSASESSSASSIWQSLSGVQSTKGEAAASKRFTSGALSSLQESYKEPTGTIPTHIVQKLQEWLPGLGDNLISGLKDSLNQVKHNESQLNQGGQPSQGQTTHSQPGSKSQEMPFGQHRYVAEPKRDITPGREQGQKTQTGMEDTYESFLNVIGYKKTAESTKPHLPSHYSYRSGSAESSIPGLDIPESTGEGDRFNKPPVSSHPSLFPTSSDRPAGSMSRQMDTLAGPGAHIVGSQANNPVSSAASLPYFDAPISFNRPGVFPTAARLNQILRK
ncbi:uncharacterized protein LOC117344976 [Pecten maximus]|uniref:uncharacterized protein LOC117344976 n=1 Tax=Pecten maximus TaxID=6579 RepID=UPI001457F984|nr:uncharacterized protein LOC117344976 [Pecten maximus]